jgi:hypothetical protein
MSHLSVLILKACLCPKKTFKDIYWFRGRLSFSSHVLEVVENLCNKIAIIKQGEFIADADAMKCKRSFARELLYGDCLACFWNCLEFSKRKFWRPSPFGSKAAQSKGRKIALSFLFVYLFASIVFSTGPCFISRPHSRLMLYVASLCKWPRFFVRAPS